MSNSDLETVWLIEASTRFSEAKFNGLLGDILAIYYGTDQLEWRHNHKYDTYVLCIKGQYSVSLSGPRIDESTRRNSRVLLREIYIPMLNICGFGLTEGDVDELISYVTPSGSRQHALEDFYVWRIGFIIYEVRDLAYKLASSEMNATAASYTQKCLSDLFSDNQGNMFALSTMVSKRYDYAYGHYNLFYKHGNYAYKVQKFEAALAFYVRFTSTSSLNFWDTMTFNYRVAILSLCYNEPSYEFRVAKVQMDSMCSGTRDHLVCWLHFRRGEFDSAIAVCQKYVGLEVDRDIEVWWKFAFGYVHIASYIQMGQVNKALEVIQIYWNDKCYQRLTLLEQLTPTLMEMRALEVSQFFKALLTSESEQKSYRDVWACMHEIVKQSVGYTDLSEREEGADDSDFWRYVVKGWS